MEKIKENEVTGACTKGQGWSKIFDLVRAAISFDTVEELN